MVQSGFDSFLEGSGMNVPDLKVRPKAKPVFQSENDRAQAVKNQKGVTRKMARLAANIDGLNPTLVTSDQEHFNPQSDSKENRSAREQIAQLQKEPVEAARISQPSESGRSTDSSVVEDKDTKKANSDQDPLCHLGSSNRLIRSQERIKQAFAEAQVFLRPFEYQRILRIAENDIFTITTGKQTFISDKARTNALEQAELRKTRAQAELKDNSPKYAQMLKKFCDYISAVENFCDEESDQSRREAMLKETVKRLEDLMMPIDNIWNGIPGKTPDLPRPGLAQTRDGERALLPHERIAQIKRHLIAKIDTVDGAQAKRIETVANNPVFKEMMRLYTAGELKDDGSVIFFTRDGLLLYQVELNAPKRLDRAQSEEAAQRHAENTPAFIDINRLRKGLGPDGAGAWRFIGQEHRIVGAAVLRTVFKDGKPVELPGNRNGRKPEPMVKKQVEAKIGDVPCEVKVEMPYGNLLNAMRSKKMAKQRGDAPAENGTACQASNDQTNLSKDPGKSQTSNVSDSPMDIAFNPQTVVEPVEPIRSAPARFAPLLIPQ